MRWTFFLNTMPVEQRLTSVALVTELLAQVPGGCSWWRNLFPILDPRQQHTFTTIVISVTTLCLSCHTSRCQRNVTDSDQFLSTHTHTHTHGPFASTKDWDWGTNIHVILNLIAYILDGSHSREMWFSLFPSVFFFIGKTENLNTSR